MLTVGKGEIGMAILAVDSGGQSAGAENVLGLRRVDWLRLARIRGKCENRSSFRFGLAGGIPG